MLEPAFHSSRKSLFHIRLVVSDMEFRSDLLLGLQLFGVTASIFGGGVRPDLMVLFIADERALPELSELRIRHPEVPLIAIVSDGDQEMEVLARFHGCARVFEQSHSLHCLLQHIETTVRRPLRLPFFMRSTGRNSSEFRLRETVSAPPKLSSREAQLLRHIVGGRTNKEVARLYDISPRTVEIHRSRIMKKYGATNLAQLIHLVIRGDGEPA